ncbi:MAG: prolyl oligopeptidase family serine peptidase [Muribaculaceae bacterium]|nr:prolyl oligopeptidase family serine peptidase [Muribaculaceae bacterium]
MIKPLLTLLAAASAFSAAADLKIDQWGAAAPITVRTPFMNDSIAPNGEKYKPTDLLRSRLRPDLQITPVTADTAGVITLQGSPAANGTLQMLKTRLRSERFAKGSLKVKSQLPFIIELNGKEISSKLTAQKDSLSPASEASAALRLEPERDANITVKFLALAGDSIAAPTFEATFVPDASFENTKLAFGPDLLRRFNLDDTEFGNRVSSLSMSPDGKYLITQYWNRYSFDRSHTYSTLTDLKTGKVINANLAWGAKWMPTGSTLYITTQAADGFDLVTIDPVTGAQTVLAEGIPTNSFTWSPDGSCFYYTHTEAGVSEQGPLRRYASPDDRMPGYRTRYFIMRYTPATGISERLTFGNHTTSLRSISRDGKKLLCSNHSEDPTTRPFYRNTFYILDTETLAVDTLVAPGPSFLTSAMFSPDAKEVLFLGSPSSFNELGKNCGDNPIANDFDIQAYIMNLETRNVTPISKEFDPSITRVVSWNNTNGLIYFLVEEGFGHNLYSFNPKSGAYTLLPTEIDNISSATMGDDENATIAYMGNGYHYAGKAYILDLKKGRNTLLADPRAADLAKINLGKVEPWTFTASDGTEIDGVICYPPDFDASKKYPLIVYYYGGTSPTSRSITQPYTPQLFASRDYVVYVVNPSGTTGYGQEFSARHVNAWGKRTANDIIEGVQKFYRTNEFVDSTKIGCLGASYGGFMTQYLQTLTPMFAAAVSHAGISNVTC